MWRIAFRIERALQEQRREAVRSLGVVPSLSLSIYPSRSLVHPPDRASASAIRCLRSLSLVRLTGVCTAPPTTVDPTLARLAWRSSPGNTDKCKAAGTGPPRQVGGVMPFLKQRTWHVPLSGSRTILKLTSWVCGTDTSSLERMAGGEGDGLPAAARGPLVAARLSGQGASGPKVNSPTNPSTYSLQVQIMGARRVRCPRVYKAACWLCLDQIRLSPNHSATAGGLDIHSCIYSCIRSLVGSSISCIDSLIGVWCIGHRRMETVINLTGDSDQLN